MALWQVLGVVSGVAVLAALVSYNQRVHRLIEKYDGFSRGFASLVYGLGFHHIDKTHPSYPQAMDQELRSLRAHRLIVTVALIIFAGFILFGAASRVLG